MRLKTTSSGWWDTPEPTTLTGMLYGTFLVENGTGPARAAKLHGKDFLVVPMTLVVPGVLEGSQGPLYYPADELSFHPEIWNSMPLVGYHPMRGATPASARDPEVLDRQGLGYTFNARFDDALRADGWFDLELTSRFDRGLPGRHQILPRLRRGERIELSTGLYYDPESAPAGAVFNGRPYHAVARKYRPDHVAVLPDAVGACSIRDGCGVLVNHKVLPGDNMPLTPEQKQGLVTFLVTNCSCWKKPGDVAILNSLPDDKLQELKDAAEKTLPPPPAPADPLLNPERVKALADALRPHLMPPAPAPAPAPSAGANPAVTPAPAAPIPVAQPVTANEWLAGMPTEIQGMFAGLRSMSEYWKQQEDRQKQELADRLVANVGDVVQRQATHALLMNKSLTDLQLMVTLQPQAPAGLLGGLFVGAPGASPAPGGAYDPVNGSDQDLLLTPTINWGESRRTKRQGERHTEEIRNGQ